MTVFAFPKASRMGLAWSSWASSSPWPWARPALEERETLARRTSFLPPAVWWEAPATVARYWMTFLVFSVLPAPDSPLQEEEEGEQGCGVEDKGNKMGFKLSYYCWIHHYRRKESRGVRWRIKVLKKKREKKK